YAMDITTAAAGSRDHYGPRRMWLRYRSPDRASTFLVESVIPAETPASDTTRITSRSGGLCDPPRLGRNRYIGSCSAGCLYIFVTPISTSRASKFNPGGENFLIKKHLTLRPHSIFRSRCCPASNPNP